MVPLGLTSIYFTTDLLVNVIPITTKTGQITIWNWRIGKNTIAKIYQYTEIM
jgi:hypothetical protein